MISERRNTCLRDAPQARAHRRMVLTLAALLCVPLSVSSLHAQETTAPEAPAPAKRLSIAFLGLENQTGDPELAHWRHATTLLSGSLQEVKAVRVLSGEAVRYALRQVGLQAGAPIDPNRARRMGELIEAQRVIWGNYSKQGDLWQVRARLMNVATGTVSAELSAEGDDWFDIRDRLNAQILAELTITPSPEETRKMVERWTRSAEGLDWYLRGRALDEQNKPAREGEVCARRAIATDPNGALPYCALAADLATQGKFDLAEDAAQKALRLKADSGHAHFVLGWIRLAQNQWSQAEPQLRRACQLDPDNADYLVYFAATLLSQGKADIATPLFEKAVSLDRTNALTHAGLATAYAIRQQREDALRELEEARRYLPEGGRRLNTLSTIAGAYERLGKRPEAIEYHERTLPLSRELGVNPDMIRMTERHIRRLKSEIKPMLIEAALPRSYTEEEFEAVLRERLTGSERPLVAHPFSCTDAMREWARELTREARTDLDKARAIFDVLSARLDSRGQRRSRSAREVFADWKKSQTNLVCMDLAVLFVALARAADVNAFFVNVTKDPDGLVTSHACAAVFTGEGVLLADPSFHWLGVPHRQYRTLDDLQTAAFLCFYNWEGDPRELAACRAGVKLWPDFVQGQLCLVGALWNGRRVDEARRMLSDMNEPRAQDLEAAMYWSHRGLLALHDRTWQEAEAHLRRAVSIYPRSPAYFILGNLYRDQHRLAEARAAFRAYLRHDPHPLNAGIAQHYIARINEEIGVEAAADALLPERKP